MINTPEGTLPKEGLFHRPIASEEATHLPNDETKDGRTSCGNSCSSEEQHSFPRPSFLAMQSPAWFPPRRERALPLIEPPVPPSGLGASARLFLFPLEERSHSSLQKPKLLRTGLFPNVQEQGLRELTNLPDPLARDLLPCPIRGTRGAANRSVAGNPNN